MFTKAKAFAFLAILIVALTGIALGTVAAQTPEAEEVHCVVELAPLAEGQVTSEVTQEITCFDTFEEASNVFIEGAQDVHPAPEREAKEIHCVAEVAPLAKGQLASKPTELGCFDTFAEAIFVATGGAVKLNNDVLPSEVTEEMLNGARLRAPRAAGPVIGVDYNGIDFTGSTLTWRANNDNGCYAGIGFAASSMPSGWNDVVSSARSYSGCNQYIHYEDTNYGGTSITCNQGENCREMGYMDNKTSSEKWLP